MSDCSGLFLAFNDTISLTDADRKVLRSARNAITTKIKKYFTENAHCPKVEFKVQGSFTMNTIIKPIDGDYDIDIGVYLKGYTNYQSSWPKPEAASQWLINALRDHTTTPPVNKRNCVRIIYKPKSASSNVSFHVDLPLYCEYTDWLGDKYTRIGIVGDKQWSQKSDPTGFTQWFNGKCQQSKDKSQLVRLVKYLKAWKEFNKNDSKFPSGMALTILAANNYCPDSREDIAFCRTIEKAYDSLFSFWSLSEEQIKSPVQPYNNVLARLSDTQIKNFKKSFTLLVTNAKNALKEQDYDTASDIWRKQFGARM